MCIAGYFLTFALRRHALIFIDIVLSDMQYAVHFNICMQYLFSFLLRYSSYLIVLLCGNTCNTFPNTLRVGVCVCVCMRAHARAYVCMSLVRYAVGLHLINCMPYLFWFLLSYSYYLIVVSFQELLVAKT